MMCCTNPRFACAVYPATTREKAHEKVTGIFVDAHFSECAIKGYYSARTGNVFSRAWRAMIGALK